MTISRKIIILLAAALVILLLAAPRDSAPRDERFGVMTHFAQGWDPRLIPLVAQASIPTVRDELYWSAIEPQRGVFTFPAAYDGYMAALRRNQVAPLIVLSFENENYDGGDTPHTPEACAAFARYAVEVLHHYGRQIRAVEIWNEYNGSFNRGPATADRPGHYLQMLRAAYAAIKCERPDVLVIGGATSGVPLPYWEKLLAGGALDCTDALSIHPYRYDQPPEGLETDVAGLQELVREHNGGKPRPIWVTEIGWATRASQAPGDLAIDDNTQAQFLVRASALLLSADVERVYWYLFQDYNGLAMGLVRDDPPRTPKPAYRAMSTLVRQLRGARFVRREDTPAELYSLLFERPSGEAVRVVWSLQPQAVTATGATAIVDLNGKSVAIAGPLALTESPLFITGPLTGLPAAPPAAETTLADSVRDFSRASATGEWSYGDFVGDAPVFAPLSVLAVSDWKKSWEGDDPYLSLTAGDQHPSVRNDTPVTAVRRWRSRYAGTVHVTGRFRCGLEGDGVGVSVAVDGERRFRQLIGGGKGTPIAAAFDFTVPVQPGTTLDFAVDPGPAANIDYDATTVAVSIRREEEP